MKGVEKTKVHMHDRMILVVYTNQNSQLSQPTSMVKTTFMPGYFNNFLSLKISTVKNGYNDYCY